MNKSPAFQFYPKDFLSDPKVAVMTNEEIGMYTKLLCYCWIEEGLPIDQEEVRELCGNPDNWERHWKKLSKCFYENGGKLRQKRLDAERKKQEEWREKSREGGKKSGESRRKKKGGSRVVQPKANISSSSSSSSSIPKNKKEDKGKPLSSCSENSFSEVDLRLTQLLIDLILENDPKSSVQRMTKKQQKNWIDECRRLREVDKRTPEEIEFVIKWTQQDDFELKNVLSMPKLRKRFSQLSLKAKRYKKSKFVTDTDW